ncbi:2-oxoglutarate synthase [Palaeococcus pacificus DY20341]|uniref:2-oxoglutarate synthase n=1 Tax=Palaeococcus pacificus DY20341 TaxID=1343739 RepID=A0A075LTT3_9EURY|nr:2-oxoacid:ferredoxin oxidoreductase subunit beta [Palaeococcus pacificus]AIF69531.1 2-oxoglutarate synthase [Palaeococcus pacificus DY20341]
MEKIHTKYDMAKYLRKEALPTALCPGCGGGTVLNAFANAVDQLKIDPKDLVMVSGIGCSAWIASPYFLADTLHTTHGRAIAFATGVKVGLPDKKVVVISGDGDLAGIGGNHLIHAARRNVDITVILVNNFIYGMTGGQVGPTTPFGANTTTSPYGNIEHPINISETIAAAGASYVARWTTFHVYQLIESIKKALQVKGFSLVEVVSQCPVQFGRRNRMKTPAEMLRWFQKNSVPISKAKNMSPEELEGKIVIGEIISRERPEFTEELNKIIEKLGGGE